MAILDNVDYLDNPVYNAYIFYCSVLILKMLIMSPLTGRQRFTKGVFANPEDAIASTLVHKGARVKIDEDVERVRRAHLNDMESIPMFIFICRLYLFTNPPAATAINLLRIFTVARIFHSIVYVIMIVRQPARAIFFTIGYGITVYMSIRTIIHFMSYM